MSDPIREVYDLVQHLGWETALEDPDMLGTEGWAVLLRKMWTAVRAHAEAEQQVCVWMLDTSFLANRRCRTSCGYVLFGDDIPSGVDSFLRCPYCGCKIEVRDANA